MRDAHTGIRAARAAPLWRVLRHPPAGQTELRAVLRAALRAGLRAALRTRARSAQKAW
jgi:hypothetical protein